MTEDNDENLTPENLDAFLKKAQQEVNEEALNLLWTEFKSIHKGMLAGGFTEEQANDLLVGMIWKFMKEGLS